MAGKTIDELRAELEAKRAANLKKEESQTDEATEPQREILIEDKRTEAYASDGLLESQLLTIRFPGIGLVLFRTPADLVYRSWSKKSGALKGELTEDTAVHDELVRHCCLAPEYKEFDTLARLRCPRAPTQFVSEMIKRMEGKVKAEGK